MKRFQGILSYDGTSFLGFQKAREGRSIQEEVSRALNQLSGETVSVEGAGRTDKGVHAVGQSIGFTLKKEISPSALLKALNGLLPLEIRMKKLFHVHGEFHPSLDAKRKQYRYYLSNTPFQIPMERLYSWHIPLKLNIEAMREQANVLMGIRDFGKFSTKTYLNPFCNLDFIEIHESSTQIEIWIQGDRFLYKMVRLLVGYLVELGKGRGQEKITAPAHGLFLQHVIY